MHKIVPDPDFNSPIYAFMPPFFIIYYLIPLFKRNLKILKVILFTGFIYIDMTVAVLDLL